MSGEALGSQLHQNHILARTLVAKTSSMCFLLGSLQSLHSEATWRWLLFIGCLGCIWLSGYVAVFLAIRLTETALWYRYNAIYYTFSVPVRALLHLLKGHTSHFLNVCAQTSAMNFPGSRPCITISHCLWAHLHQFCYLIQRHAFTSSKALR
jgi:hypothetical protein